MGEKANARYCSRGEGCTKYTALGKPAKLSRYNPETICAQCSRADKSDLEGRAVGNGAREAERDTPPTPVNQKDVDRRSEGSNVLDSDAGARLTKLKRELVLQLYTKRGLFWELVHEVRTRRGITVIAQLPPRTPGPPIPKGEPDSSTDQERWKEFHARWQADIFEIQQRVMPERYRDVDSFRDWFYFLAACVVYDPPGTDLLAFAAYGDPTPTTIHEDRFDDDDYAELPHMVDPPVKTLRDLSKMRDRLWAYAIEELLTRLSGTPGEWGDVRSMVATAELCVEELAEEQRETAYEAPEPYYIEVDEHATLEDVKRAFKLIARAQEERQPGSCPKRDRLTAVECATLRKSLDFIASIDLSTVRSLTAGETEIRNPGAADVEDLKRRYLMEGSREG